MANLSTELEEHKTELEAELYELEDELQHRKDKDHLRIGNALKTISREITDWENRARESDDSDESTRNSLMQQAREIRSRLARMRSE